jgi:hypothetical protein
MHILLIVTILNLLSGQSSQATNYPFCNASIRSTLHVHTMCVSYRPKTSPRHRTCTFTHSHSH